jgi:hypothetical protein
MSDEWLALVEHKQKQKHVGARIGSWIGTAICALGTSACLTIMVLGSRKIMEAGGFVASGGPYQIAHPVPAGSWVLPLAFTGLFAFSAAHTVFASRIKAPRLVHVMWCALWTAVGADTLWYGFRPPSGSGLAWGWLIMGGIFLLVGLGSVVGVFATRNLFDWTCSELSAGKLAVYWTVTVAVVLAGIALGVAAVSAAA